MEVGYELKTVQKSSREPIARGQDQFGPIGQRAARNACKGEQIWTVSPSKQRSDGDVETGEGGDGEAVSAGGVHEKLMLFSSSLPGPDNSRTWWQRATSSTARTVEPTTEIVAREPS